MNCALETTSPSSSFPFGKLNFHWLPAFNSASGVWGGSVLGQSNPGLGGNGAVLLRARRLLRREGPLLSVEDC